MFSKGNRGSLIAHPSQEWLQFPQVPPSSHLRSIPKAGEGQEEPPRPPGTGTGTALCSQRYNHCHISPALLGCPSGKHPWSCCTPSSLWDVPTPSAQLSLGFPWDCCRRGHGQRSLSCGPWPGSPGNPNSALPCHGDTALGPSAGKGLAGCHSPVQKHRRLASDCCSMSNLPRRAKSRDTDLQILL